MKNKRGFIKIFDKSEIKNFRKTLIDSSQINYYSYININKFLILSIILLLIINPLIIPQETGDKTIAEQETPEQKPATNSLPSGTPTVPTNLLGEINPQTGKPKNLETLQKYGDYFREKEQNKSFLQQEWGILLANNKYIGPALFYTEGFFDFFNPLWKAMFGMEFSWSFGFFVGLFLWLEIIFVVYFPGKEIFENKLFGLITGGVVATLTGTAGVIKGAILFATPFIKNIWHLAILIFIACMLAYIYEEIFKSMKKQSEEEKLRRAKEATIAHGEVAQHGLEAYRGEGGTGGVG